MSNGFVPHGGTKLLAPVLLIIIGGCDGDECVYEAGWSKLPLQSVRLNVRRERCGCEMCPVREAGMDCHGGAL